MLVLRPKRLLSHVACIDVTDSLVEIPALIRKVLVSDSYELEQCSRYLIDGRGKAVRPSMVLLMGASCNNITMNKRFVSPSQKTVAMVTEMIHTASLIHDDIIDGADTRRGRPTINKLWGEKKAVEAGNFILAQASRALAGLDNPHVIDLLTNVIEDLVQGEVLQLASNCHNDRSTMFENYLEKTFKKTASLMAYSCQAAAVLSRGGEELSRSAYNFGKFVGLSFQIVDDILDILSTQSAMGKPTSIDLKLGIATAPLLFTARKNPELYDIIEQGLISKSDHMQKILDTVYSCGAIKESYELAREYSEAAAKNISSFKPCPEKELLLKLSHDIIHRHN